MTGMVWSTPSRGGYLYADNLDKHLRMALQNTCKFRAFADPKEDALGLHKGNTYRWDRISTIANRGGPLSELQRMPESQATVGQSELTIQEFGNSIPYTGLLDLQSELAVKDAIDQVLRDDARGTLDRMVAYEYFQTPLRVSPASGTSTTEIVLTTNSAASTTNNIALGLGHVKAVSDTMKDRNIPAYDGDDYAAISHASTLTNVRDEMEDIHQYTETGISLIFRGEIGRYRNVRFVEQTEVPKGHANDAAFSESSASANFIYSATNDAWNNAKSSWCLFFGADTVIEAPAVPEEVRAKIPEDYGRSHGLAWYYLGGAGLTHTDAENARCILWDSAA